MMNSAKRHLLTAACAGAILSAAALAQLPIEAPTPEQPGMSIVAPPAPGTATPPAPTTKPATPAGPSAESVLEELLRQRGNNTTPGTEPLTPPGTPATPPNPSNPANLDITSDGIIREGQFIQARTGRLKRDDATGATLIVFDTKGPAFANMATVPSRRLELMENAAGFSEPKNSIDLVFPIDAEVTQYRGKNYLFIGQSAAPLPKPPVLTLPPATLPDTVAGILPQPKIEAVAPNAPEPVKIDEGELIEQRAGRFVKDPRTGAEIIVFDGDGKRMLDQPMGLIPCKYLAVMEDASENGTKPVKFRVSGQITQYRGKNYLYLKSVSIIRDIHGGIGG